MTLRTFLVRALARKLIPFAVIAVWAVSVYELPQLLGLNTFGAP